MRIEIIIDVPDDEKLKKYSKSGLIKLFGDKLKVGEKEPVKFKVYDVILSDCAAIADLDLPSDMVKCLIKHRIHYIENLSRYKFSYIYDIILKLGGKEYVDLLNDEMSKYGAKYSDIDPVAIISVGDCGLSIRTVNSLERNGCYYLQNVTAKSMEEISHMRNLGKTCMNELNTVLVNYGLWYSS